MNKCLANTRRVTCGTSWSLQFLAVSHCCTMDLARKIGVRQLLLDWLLEVNMLHSLFVQHSLTNRREFRHFLRDLGGTSPLSPTRKRTHATKSAPLRGISWMVLPSKDKGFQLGFPLVPLCLQSLHSFKKSSPSNRDADTGIKVTNVQHVPHPCTC